MASDNTTPPVGLIRLASSNLASMQYDAESRVLTVTFHNGDSWNYGDVSPVTANGLANASSPGKYFLSEIRPSHPGTRA